MARVGGRTEKTLDERGDEEREGEGKGKERKRGGAGKKKPRRQTENQNTAAPKTTPPHQTSN
jgi:hypothetical protein